MPTWKGMFNARRVPVTLCVTVALFCAPSVAAAVTTTSDSGTTAPGSTTPSTLAPGPGNTPAPPAFSLPTDFGLQLINEQNTAKQAIASAKAALPDAKKKLK